jgi:hypothetical protein
MQPAFGLTPAGDEMNPRIKKLIGGVGILAFLAVYISLAIVVAELLPAWPLVKLVYFVVVGVAWGVPIIPFITWMNKEE